MPKTTATAPTADQLRACTTRETAAALLPSALLRAQLNTVAAEVGIASPAGYRTKQAVIDAIVQQAVGHRLSHEAILNSRWDRPIPPDATDLRPSPLGVAVIERALIRQMEAMTAGLHGGRPVDLTAACDLAAAATALAAAAAGRAAGRVGQLLDAR